MKICSVIAPSGADAQNDKTKMADQAYRKGRTCITKTADRTRISRLGKTKMANQATRKADRADGKTADGRTTK